MRKVNAKGITLIALIITIVILLILAGVTIAILSREKGIVNKENKAQTEAKLNLEETKYTDKNKKTITIPKEMAVSQIEGENEIDKGLVAIDKNGNEWVWVEVPKTIYETASSETDYINIEKDMQKYANVYEVNKYKSILFSKEQHGFENIVEYNNHNNTMLSSVYKNGGFFIGKYEVGTKTQRKVKGDALSTAEVKENMYPYNYVTCSQSQTLARGLAAGGKTSSLMFEIQVDLVYKYMEEKGISQDGTKLTESMIKTESSSWGNYRDVTFDITKGKYSENSGTTFNSVLLSYTKPKDSSVLLTTGATSRNKILNIYDFVGNEWEWTLEQTSDTKFPCTYRGGGYSNNRQ